MEADRSKPTGSHHPPLSSPLWAASLAGSAVLRAELPEHAADFECGFRLWQICQCRSCQLQAGRARRRHRRTVCSQPAPRRHRPRLRESEPDRTRVRQGSKVHRIPPPGNQQGSRAVSPHAGGSVVEDQSGGKPQENPKYADLSYFVIVCFGTTSDLYDANCHTGLKAAIENEEGMSEEEIERMKEKQVSFRNHSHASARSH